MLKQSDSPTGSSSWTTLALPSGNRVKRRRREMNGGSRKVREYKCDPPQREMYEIGETTGVHDMTSILVRTPLVHDYNWKYTGGAAKLQLGGVTLSLWIFWEVKLRSGSDCKTILHIIQVDVSEEKLDPWTQRFIFTLCSFYRTPRFVFNFFCWLQDVHRSSSHIAGHALWINKQCFPLAGTRSSGGASLGRK